VACGATTAKRQLTRIVRDPSGTIKVDETGKAPGRGAYVCPQPDCWDRAIRKGKLERSLKAALSAADAQALQAFAPPVGQGGTQ
jgi:predicted RNA-binding protein YlxR (DUF448 family)